MAEPIPARGRTRGPPGPTSHRAGSATPRSGTDRPDAVSDVRRKCVRPTAYCPGVSIRTSVPVRPSAPPDGRTIAAVVVTVLAWASAFVGIRAVGEDLSPGALALGRLLVGSAVLGLLLARRGWVRPTAGEWRLLAVCGIGWFGIYNLALNAAERHLDAGTTA